MKNLKNNLLMVLMVVVALAGCKPEDAPINPCAETHATTATFTMMETFDINAYSSGWLYYDTDTALAGQITFRAIENNADSFIWQIGNEPSPRKGAQVNVIFTSSQIGTTIPIGLIVKKTPNTLCFPKDIGADTVTRNLTFVAQPKWLGKWNGISTDQPDSNYILQIIKYYYQGLPSLGFIQLVRGCVSDTIRMEKGSAGYNELSFQNHVRQDLCGSIDGIAICNSLNQISIYYSIRSKPLDPIDGSRINKTFLGTRIP